VRDIPCGTKGGVLITFEKIEVSFLRFVFLLASPLLKVCWS